jgi:diguanylate cyclase (GGDEF)-like protein/PAS domain S-box-containing protein
MHDPARLTPSTSRATTIVGASACLGLLIYEATKTALLPRLTLWQSHSVTIAVGSIVAMLATHRALRAQAQLHQRVLRATAEQLYAESERAALRGSEARYRELVERSPEAILVHRDGAVLYANPTFLRLWGDADDAALPDAPLSAYLHRDDRPLAEARMRALAAGDGETAAAEYRITTRAGHARTVEASSVVVTHDGAPAVQTVLRDVTERRRLEAQLYHQAFHDGLTGLANRALFRDRVQHALELSGRDAAGHHSAAVAVLFLDLDHFKHVNDAHGHATGDALLVTVADRLRTATRGCDTIARLGGDEFAVLLEHLVHQDDANVVAERVLTSLRTPIRLAGNDIVVGISVGIATGTDADGVDALLRNADLALYAAKERGRFRSVRYVPAMHAAALERSELETDLRPGMSDPATAGFRLVYQPIVDLTTEETVGVEALLRWDHPTRGPVSPTTFIPVAEETGLIVPLGRWVIGEACRQTRAWDREMSAFPARRLGPGFALSINLSARQLQDPEIVRDVALGLAESGLAPHRLVLEITESVMMHDPVATRERLRELKALGVRIAIDDFGTGYSSLAYLRQFPVDVLKIDKSFIDGLGHGGDESVITTAIVSLGASLALRVIAEGIEDAQQLERLRALGCDRGQGFLFARPLTPDQMMTHAGVRA